MNSDELSSAGYLQELYNSTQGNIEAQVSMYDIGLNIGIDKAEAGRVAEGLMVQGLIELKTLAGGISITEEGLISLGITPQSENTPDEQLTFSSELIANDSDRDISKKFITAIQAELTKENLEYTIIEQIVLDIKAIELHLISPTPKTSVLLALFHSIAHCFTNEEILSRTGLTILSQEIIKQ
ncbi:hypothetical protein [Desulforhopalus sp. 52FAK]